MKVYAALSSPQPRLSLLNRAAIAPRNVEVYPHAWKRPDQGKACCPTPDDIRAFASSENDKIDGHGNTDDGEKSGEDRRIP